MKTFKILVCTMLLLAFEKTNTEIEITGTHPSIVEYEMVKGGENKDGIIISIQKQNFLQTIPVILDTNINPNELSKRN